MEQVKAQIQKLSLQQMQSIEILQLNAMELGLYIRELSLTNPLVELPEETALSGDSKTANDLVEKLRWLEENDYANRYTQAIDYEEGAPLDIAGTSGGLEETLLRNLTYQILSLKLDSDMEQLVCFLAANLDEDGYLRIPLNELAADAGASLPRMEQGLAILRSLEPAGVGADSLSQCLFMQLERMPNTELAQKIVKNHLELLAKRQYRRIATELSTSVGAVQSAVKQIQTLAPQPGMGFDLFWETHYILPDVYIEEHNGQLIATIPNEKEPLFYINNYYRKLLQTGEQNVRAYLSEKLKQAEGVLRAAKQRENTILRCAQFIADYQAEFFLSSSHAMRTLRLTDIAGGLNLHESTISRALQGKHLQCKHGIYPLNYFLTRSATMNSEEETFSGKAARALLRKIIEEEDKAAPLSDKKLCEHMAMAACPVSRRTVAKYREEMQIPPAAQRRNEL